MAAKQIPNYVIVGLPTGTVLLTCSDRSILEGMAFNTASPDGKPSYFLRAIVAALSEQLDREDRPEATDFAGDPDFDNTNVLRLTIERVCNALEEETKAGVALRAENEELRKCKSIVQIFEWLFNGTCTWSAQKGHSAPLVDKLACLMERTEKAEKAVQEHHVPAHIADLLEAKRKGDEDAHALDLCLKMCDLKTPVDYGLGHSHPVVHRVAMRLKHLQDMKSLLNSDVVRIAKERDVYENTLATIAKLLAGHLDPNTLSAEGQENVVEALAFHLRKHAELGKAGESALHRALKADTEIADLHHEKLALDNELAQLCKIEQVAQDRALKAESRVCELEGIEDTIGKLLDRRVSPESVKDSKYALVHMVAHNLLTIRSLEDAADKNVAKDAIQQLASLKLRYDECSQAFRIIEECVELLLGNMEPAEASKNKHPLINAIADMVTRLSYIKGVANQRSLRVEDNRLQGGAEGMTYPEALADCERMGFYKSAPKLQVSELYTTINIKKRRRRQ